MYSAPLFSLLIKGWVSACLFTALFISVLGLIEKTHSSNQTLLKNLIKDKNFFYLIAIPLSLPILVVFFTNIVKGHHEFADFDGPSRYIFGLIILIYLIKKDVQIGEKFIFPILLMPILTFCLVDFFEKKAWSKITERLTIYFIDPIIFGSICLTFAMLSLVVLLSKKNSLLVTFLSLFGFVSGCFLSIHSESRTGWFAIPFVIFVMLRYLASLNSFKALLLSIFISITLGLILFNFSGTINKRIGAMVEDLNRYQWKEANQNTSSGERISFIRMGWYFMTLRPLTGWNGMDFLMHKDDANIAKFASPETRAGVKGGGFHNEYINNAVKYGFFGLLFSLFLIICPAIFFIRKLSEDNKNIAAVLGLVLSIMYFFSCITYQVLDFKFTISLYTIMVILLVASSLQYEKTNSSYSK